MPTDRVLTRTKLVLEMMSSVMMIVLAAVAITVLIRSRHESRIATNVSYPQPASSAPSLVGKHLSPAQIDWNGQERTLIFAISSQCHFCVNSADFYSRLTHLPRQSHVVFVMPQNPDVVESFLRHHNITPDRHISEPLDQVRVDGTPTVLLVDSKGVVVRSWIGELDRSGEKEVLDALNRGL